MSPKKKFLASTRSKVIFCIFGVLFSLVVILLSTDIDLGGLFPSETTLENARRDQKKALAAFTEAEKKQKEYLSVSQEYKKLMDECWVESRDGLPDIELRKKIETAARTAGIEQVNISTARRNRINNDLYFLEVDVNTTAAIDLMITFWRELGKLRPPIGWKRFELRPEQNQNSDQLILSSTIRLLGKETVQEANAKNENTEGAQ